MNLIFFKCVPLLKIEKGFAGTNAQVLKVAPTDPQEMKKVVFEGLSSNENFKKRK